MNKGADHVLGEAFFFPIPGPTAGGRRFRCQCRDCPMTWEFGQGGRATVPPPEQVFKRARRDGWIVGIGKKPRCPTHAVGGRRPANFHFDQGPPAPVKQPLKEGVTTMSATAAASVTQIQPNFKLVRQVMILLDDHFDEKAKRYRAPWSDEAVAKETGVHVGQVAKIRVDAFGELAEDPVVVKLRDDIAGLELMIEELAKEAKTLAGKLERYAVARAC